MKYPHVFVQRAKFAVRIHHLFRAREKQAVAVAHYEITRRIFQIARAVKNLGVIFLIFVGGWIIRRGQFVHGAKDGGWKALNSAVLYRFWAFYPYIMGDIRADEKEFVFNTLNNLICVPRAIIKCSLLKHCLTVDPFV